MAIHLPIGSLKPALGWSRYRDVNPVPTSLLADDNGSTVPSGPVFPISGMGSFICTIPQRG